MKIGKSKWQPMFLCAVVVGSGMGVAAGFLKSFAYDAKPGQAASAAEIWPAQSHVARAAGIPTLVMMVHPECPCSRASLDELAVLMARCPGLLEGRVLLVRPEGYTKKLEETEHWQIARQIAGVTPVADETGEGVRLFGAQTSGQVLLYDAGGVLRFEGGITESRGHEGDNDGLTIIEKYVKTGQLDGRKTPVYGCALGPVTAAGI